MENKIIKLKDITPGMAHINLKDVTVVEVGEIKEIEVKGEKTKICVGQIIDDSVKDPINITAWNFSAQFFKDSKKIDIENAYCKLYENVEEGIKRVELTTGKYGKIIKVL